MSGLPTSLAGMIGFIIFVVFIVAITVPSINSRDTETIKSLQEGYQQNNTVNSTSLNQSTGFWGFIGTVTGLNGVYDYIVGFFQMIINFIKLVLAYLGIFTNVFSQVPTIFYIIFLIVGSSVVIGIIKLIFLAGD